MGCLGSLGVWSLGLEGVRGPVDLEGSGVNRVGVTGWQNVKIWTKLYQGVSWEWLQRDNMVH